MLDSLVRICEIRLTGFKNTTCGVVQMPSELNEAYFMRHADVLGIYGQNGSGKTAVIEAMDFIQRLLTGKPLPADAVEYIGKDQGHCSIEVTFAIEYGGVQSQIIYTASLSRLEDNNFCISRESLVSRLWNGERSEPKKTLLCFTSEDESGRFRKIAQKEHCSVIFSKEGRQIFLTAPVEVSADYKDIIDILHRYAHMNLFVIPSAHSGSITLNLILPFAFRLDMGKTIAKGDLPVRLDAPSVITKTHYKMVQQIIVEMNTVLGTIIPGLAIDIHDFGEQLLENGEAGHKIELLSKRGEIQIPLKYESEGIIKIISILNVLMCVYNDPSMCLVIDELDAGIYEYLLGELLSVFEKGAKGQLIFTSHNLRALEMLNKTSILFSTTNPENRYMRLQNVKTNNNLRDLYLRSITLGGQKEDVYAETDTVEIGRAFRRAGKAVHDGN